MTRSAAYIHPAPTSLSATLIMAFLRLSGWKRGFARRIEKDTSPKEPARVPKNYAREFVISTSLVAGRTVFTLAPRAAGSGRSILYLHGGAYVANILIPHWFLIAALIRQTGATVIVPDYPLAPQATVRESFPMVEQVYQNLLATVSPDNIIVMGDSAGGGYALALAQKLRQQGVPGPAQLVLLSPWLDVTMANPAIQAIAEDDPMLSVAALRLAGKAWAGPLETLDPLVSPIYGPMDGLGQISVFIGGKDLFLADARQFKDRLEQQKIDLNYFEYPTMFHVWMAVPFLSESKTAIGQMASLVRQTARAH